MYYKPTFIHVRKKIPARKIFLMLSILSYYLITLSLCLPVYLYRFFRKNKLVQTSSSQVNCELHVIANISLPAKASGYKVPSLCFKDLQNQIKI